MKTFFKNIPYTLLTVASRAIGSLVVNKLTALYFGTAGITLLAHFQNLVNLFTQVPNDGLNRGLIRFTSSGKTDLSKLSAYFFASLGLNLFIFIGGLIILWIWPDVFYQPFFGEQQAWVFQLFILAMVLFLLHLFLQSYLLAFENFLGYFSINLFSTLITLALVYMAAMMNNLAYLLVAFLIGQGSGWIMSLWFLKKGGYFAHLSFQINTASLKGIGEFGLMALSVLVFGKLTDFFVRDYAIATFGLEWTGLWQSVVKLSDNYLMLFTGTVGVIFYPQVAARIFDITELKRYVKQTLGSVMAFSLLGLSAIYLLRHWLLELLFSENFTAAGDLVFFQVVGDWFGMGAFLMVYVISAQARTLTFFWLQGVSMLLYILFIALLIGHFHIEAFPMAHACRQFLFLLLVLYLNRRILR